MSATRPTAVEAALLLHALCDRRATDVGARVLAIKGPAVAMQGLRAPRASADIDVLVQPDDLDAFVEAMTGAGWRHAVEPTAPRLVRAHSVNLLHDHWPLGIDVHHHFPGFLAPDREVFEVLWARRTTLEMAGVAVAACDVVSQLAIVALHLLREDPDGVSPRVADLVAHAGRELDDDDLASLRELAHVSDSAVPLRPVLLALGIQDVPVEAAHPDALRGWFDRGRAVPGMVWGRHLREAPWWRWPHVLWHAVMLTDAEVDAYHGGDGTSWGRARARLRRLGRFAGLLPGIATELRGKSPRARERARGRQ